MSAPPVTREDIEAAALASALLGRHLARADGGPAPAAENWRMMREAAEGSGPRPPVAPDASPWWREAFEAFSASRIEGRIILGRARTSSVTRIPFDSQMIRALMAGRVDVPAVYRSTDPGRP